MNHGRREVVFFTIRRKTKEVVWLEYQGVKLNVMKDVKYLRITLHKGLMWKTHVENQVKKGMNNLWSGYVFNSRTCDLTPRMSLWLYINTSSPGKLSFAQKCILGKWLCNVTKGVGRVCNVFKSSAGCSKVCGNDYLKGSVRSGHMVTDCGVKPLSAIICLMKWGALQLPILSPNILQC